jgi:hypothetical protein
LASYCDSGQSLARENLIVKTYLYTNLRAFEELPSKKEFFESQFIKGQKGG